ncbi:MAG: chemotaxis protein CheB [Cyanobacteria bacterium P01_A01_bin.135]
MTEQPEREPRQDNMPPSAEPPPPDGSGDRIPVVGVGASAGGLEAFAGLLSALPSDTGMAFVLVLHLDPDGESQLSQILARHSAMPVQEAEDGMAIAPDQVYVIPPGSTMTLAEGRLQLRREARSRLHHAIDIFFCSLAKACRDRAIGVVLSGSNDDGTLGLEAIKAAGGIALAQSGSSAQMRTMPNTAIATGQVDFTGTPAELAQALVHTSRHPYLSPEGAPGLPEEGELSDIFALLRTTTGVDFSLYKETTLRRRIFRRMALLRLEALPQYVGYLREHAAEVESLYHEILIGATGFFRDGALFEALKQDVFPTLMENRSVQAPIRILVAGCSTGEEAYSMGICLLEFLSQAIATPPIQIFATDLSDAAIEQARQGIYPASRVANVSPERLQRFFMEVESGYQVTKRLREICIFARQNLLGDPPFSKLDLVSCRNVLIYFKPPAQRNILSVIHYSLKSPGFLVLGSSEAAGTVPELFTSANPKQKIYLKQPSSTDWDFSLAENIASEDVLNRTPNPWSRSAQSDAGISRAAEQALLHHHNSAAVIIDGQLNILQFLGQTGAYIDPAPGQASLNLLRLSRPELQIDLRSAIHQAKETQQTVSKANVYLRRPAAPADLPETQRVNLVVLPFKPSMTAETYFVVLFEDMTSRPEAEADAPQEGSEAATYSTPEAEQVIQQLQQELETTKIHLQSIIEEQEATNQDLRAANEEILSSNEELQSTNEELQTAKEEIQATNEELSTINEELYQRNADTTRISNDFQNLLGSINIPIVMVESELRIRRFTPTAAKLFNLIPTDIGRPLNDIRHNLIIDDLEGRILDVVRNLTQITEQVQDQNGRWYDLRVRPYRTMDNRIDGAVLVMVAIDALKRSSEAQRVAQTYADAIVQTVEESLLVLNEALQVVTATRQFYHTFGLTAEASEGRSLFELGDGQWNNAELRSLLAALDQTGAAPSQITGTITLAQRQLRIDAHRFLQPGQPPLVLVKVQAAGSAPAA